MPPPPKFASFIPQKRHTPFFYCHSDFLFLSTNFQMPEAVLSSKFGSMVVSEPVLLNRTKSNIVSLKAPIFVYYSWAASYMRQPNYVGLKKNVLILPLNQILMKGQPLTSDI